jgi:hypothetical protein
VRPWRIPRETYSGSDGVLENVCKFETK